MMKQAVKVIITVAVALVCCFVVIFSFGYFYYEQDMTGYQIGQMVPAELLDVQLKELGPAYQGYEQEGTSYYMLMVTMNNPANSQKEDYEVYFSYQDDAGRSFGKVVEVGETYPNDGSIVVPAGMTGVISRVLQIDDDCKSFTLKYRNYVTEEEQEIEITL